jgi:hypothetical protein
MDDRPSTMTPIALLRLSNQHIAAHQPAKPEEMIADMGMLQAQDYLGALWAVGLRLKNASEKQVEQALAERRIVRTWPARGTLHFVAADDARWMVELLAPRLVKGAAGRFRGLELDEVAFGRSRDVFVEALQGGRTLTREGMYQLLESHHISTAGQRGIHILWKLAQDGLICFGPRQGKQQTFVLLDEWVPSARSKPRDEALAELALRYFSSHGPATLQDFTWWSGLTTAAAKTGIEGVGSQLVQEHFNGQTFYQSGSRAAVLETSPAAHLLPAFDEYLVGYKDRSAVLDPRHALRVNNGGGILNPAIVIDGQVLGTWKRTLQKASVTITPSWFSPPDESQMQALISAANRYGAFLNLRVIMN